MNKRASTGAFGAAERGGASVATFLQGASASDRAPAAASARPIRRSGDIQRRSNRTSAGAPSQVEMLAAPRGPANMSTSAHISWGKHYRMIWHSLSDGRRLDVRRYGPLTRGAAPGAQTHCHN